MTLDAGTAAGLTLVACHRAVRRPGTYDDSRPVTPDPTQREAGMRQPVRRSRYVITMWPCSGPARCRSRDVDAMSEPAHDQPEPTTIHVDHSR